MKKHLNFLSVLCLLISMFAGCGSKESSIVGKWEYTNMGMDGVYIQFFSDGTFVSESDNQREETISGNYSAENGTLRIDVDGGEKIAFQYELHGNSLSYSYNGETATLTRVK